ncbi:hypothetical protein ABG768_008134 [Culter alburnus]|uniref:Uncharacterized protein n=1 Tax=Culter alburnus TaxID=194366 RepID=A0AAW1ZRM8_CULAL
MTTKVIFSFRRIKVYHIAFLNEHVRRDLPEICAPYQYIAPHRGSLRETIERLAQYPLTPGPERNPLLSMLTWNADSWGVTLEASGDSTWCIAFYPVYNNVETSMSESSSDDEQPGPSHQVNIRSEIRFGGSHMSESSRDEEQPGPSHQVNIRSEIRSGGSYMSESSRDEEQPGPSHRVNIRSGIRPGRSRTPADS